VICIPPVSGGYFDILRIEQFFVTQVGDQFLRNQSVAGATVMAVVRQKNPGFGADFATVAKAPDKSRNR
jgi:hypothetical protein